jgi:hypothetical protein
MQFGDRAEVLSHTYLYNTYKYLLVLIKIICWEIGVIHRVNGLTDEVYLQLSVKYNKDS